MKKIIIFMAVILLLTGCTKKEETPNGDTELKDAIKFKQEYEKLNESESYITVSIPEDNAIRYASVEEIIHLLDGKTGIVFFGNPECPWSRSAIETLLNTANTAGIDKIYYLNIKEMQDQKHLEDGNIVTDKEGTTDYYNLVEAFSTVLPSYEGLNDETKKRLYSSTVIFIKDGEIVGIHEKTIEEQTDPNQKLNKEEEKKLAQIYTTYIHNVLGDVCDASC